MASSSLSDLTPDTRERAQAFLAAAKDAGLEVVVGSTLRSCADQGTSTAPVNVNGMQLKRAPGCRSWHTWGRAFDVTLIDASPERYASLGALGKTFGLQWGGDFKTNFDPIHFQFSGGLDIQKLCPDPLACDQALRNAGFPMPNTPDGPLPLLPARQTMSGWSLLSFIAGAAVGWVATKRARKR